MTKRSRASARRSAAARKGWATRRLNAERRAFRHGQRARERSEKRLTAAQKGARTRAANRVLADIRHARRSQAAKRGWATRRAHESGRPGRRPRVDVDTEPGGGGGGGEPIRSLDQLDDYGDYLADDDYDGYDIETSPDYGED